MPNRLIDGKNNPINRTGLHKPVIGVLLTAVLAVIFYELGDNEYQDVLSAAIIFFTFFIGSLVILIFTENWTWRVVGLMIAVGGAALTYLFILSGLTLESVNVNNQINKAIIRAHLCVGGVLLSLGIAQWARERYQRKHSEGAFTLLESDPTKH